MCTDNKNFPPVCTGNQNFPPSVNRQSKFPPSVHRQSRSCWTSATGQAGTLLLARVLDSTSATRWVGIVVDRRNDYKQMHRDIIAGDENVSIVGFKTPLHVLCRQSRCLCVEMFLVTLLVVCFSFDNYPHKEILYPKYRSSRQGQFLS